MMNQQDYEALDELIADMKMIEACKTVRELTDLGLLEAKAYVEQAARRCPDTALAAYVRTYCS